MPDHATADGTAAYQRRFAGNLAPGHFRGALGLRCASIGIGTYLGDADARTDDAYGGAIGAAVRHGCNVIDAAINYRFQRSERSIGAALAREFAAGNARREELIVATKGGYLSFDTAPPRDPGRWFHEMFVDTGVAVFDDLVAGCHCMTPAYLRHQLATSLRNLQLHSADIYYVHNPETQLGAVARDRFDARLRAAFAQLEEAVAAGQIQVYGVATWNGLRQPENARDYLSLQTLARLAAEAGGTDHHFRVVQAPFNLAMTEALTRRNQRIDGEAMCLLEAAQRLGITVMASASMMQGQLSHRLPAHLSEVFAGLHTDAQRAIQFVRSTAGVTTALVGMKTVAHVEENLGTALVPPVTAAEFAKLFHEAVHEA